MSGPANAARLVSVSGEEWRKDAACRDEPDKTLWDEGIEGETPTQRANRHAKAKAICVQQCTVGTECIAAFRRGIDEGIRNGRELPPLFPRPRVRKAAS
jgi:hypothetical protein